MILEHQRNSGRFSNTTPRVITYVSLYTDNIELLDLLTNTVCFNSITW